MSSYIHPTSMTLALPKEKNRKTTGAVEGIEKKILKLQESNYHNY